MGILNERACIAIEVNGLLGIEQHIFPCINLQDEIFEGTHADNAGNLLALILGHVVELTQLHRGLVSILHHQVHQVIGIDNRSLTALHLAIGKLHHTIAKVDKFFTPLETEAVKQDREYLEVVVLLVTHHINHLVDGIVLETHLSRTDVLCHIDRGSVRAQQQLLVKSLVGEVCPHAIVVVTFEESFGKPLLHLGLTFQVGLALIIYLVKRHAHLLVCLVEASIHPAVHLLPKSPHFRVVLFPLHQHVVSLLDKRSLLLGLFFVHSLGHEFLYLLAVVLIEGYIVVTDEVVALLAAGFWCLTVAVFQPCKHGFADVDTTVVDNIRLHYLVSVSLHNLRQRPTEQVVAHMTEVQGLVGIR